MKTSKFIETDVLYHSAQLDNSEAGYNLLWIIFSY